MGRVFQRLVWAVPAIAAVAFFLVRRAPAVLQNRALPVAQSFISAHAMTPVSDWSSQTIASYLDAAKSARPEVTAALAASGIVNWQYSCAPDGGVSCSAGNVAGVGDALVQAAQPVRSSTPKPQQASLGVVGDFANGLAAPFTAGFGVAAAAFDTASIAAAIAACSAAPWLPLDSLANVNPIYAFGYMFAFVFFFIVPLLFLMVATLVCTVFAKECSSGRCMKDRDECRTCIYLFCCATAEERDKREVTLGPCCPKWVKVGLSVLVPVLALSAGAASAPAALQSCATGPARSFYAAYSAAPVADWNASTVSQYLHEVWASNLLFADTAAVLTTLKLGALTGADFSAVTRSSLEAHGARNSDVLHVLAARDALLRAEQTHRKAVDDEVENADNEAPVNPGKLSLSMRMLAHFSAGAAAGTHAVDTAIWKRLRGVLLACYVVAAVAAHSTVRLLMLRELLIEYNLLVQAPLWVLSHSGGIAYAAGSLVTLFVLAYCAWICCGKAKRS